MSERILNVYNSKCIACKNCEMACAQVHAVDGKWGVSRITTIMDQTPEKPRHSIVICMQCDDAACVSACPVGAITRSSTGALEVNETTCIRCKSCVAACPFGNMKWDCRLTTPVKCDLCHGDPACAKFCPTGALKW